MVSYYFDKRRSLAMGFTVVGSGIGTVLLPPILQQLILLIGWRNTFLVLGGVILNCIICGIVLRPLKPVTVWVKKPKGIIPYIDESFSKTTGPDSTTTSLLTNSSEKSDTVLKSLKSQRKPLPQRFIKALADSFDFRLFLNLPFALLCLSNFFTSLGYNAPYLFIVPWGTKELGFTEKSGFMNNAAYLSSVIGVGNIIGRLAWGFLADLHVVNRTLLYAGTLVACGVAIAATNFSHLWWWFVFCAFVFGMLLGAYVCLTPVLVVDLVGIERLDVAFGILGLVQCVATLIGPPLLAGLRDWSGSFRLMFLGCGTCVSISGFLMLPAYFIKKKQSNSRTSETNVEGIELGEKVI